MDYKQSQGMNYSTSFRIKEKSEWSAGMILRILKNPVYTGVLEQGRVTTPSYRVKRLVNKPRKEWAIVENCHEAIIMMEQQKKSQEATVALLRKKVKKLEALQRELAQKIEKLYEDAVIDNLLSRDAYTAQKARLVEQRDEAHGAETEIQAELFELTRDRSIYMEQYQRYADMEVLPGDAIADLLDRVTVWPDGRLEVSLKFTDELPALAGTGREMKTAE